MFIVHTGSLFNFFGRKQVKDLFQEILWNRGKNIVQMLHPSAGFDDQFFFCKRPSVQQN